MMNEAIIYARFSKADQAKGHSIERQLDYTREVCAARGLVEKPSLTFVEKGRSAFSGANRVKGSLLAKLEGEIAAGYHHGRTLVVEHLDRISRQGHQEVTDFLRACSDGGVSVATKDGDRFYPAGVRVTMLDIIEIILKSELAREESEKKANRIKKKFAARRKRAAEEGSKEIASRPPSWLRRLPDRNGYEVIEEHAAIVREAHRLAQLGHGTTAIAKVFNERGLKPWRERKEGDPCKGWHESYILRMLKMRTSIGEYTSDKYGTRILDYYPSIITVEEYDRTQAAMAKRRNPASRGRRGTLQSSLFSGLTMCACCHRSMVMTPGARTGTVNAKSRKGERVTRNVNTPRNYLKCVASSRRLMNDAGERICVNSKGIRYERLEPAVLDKIMTLALDNDRFNVAEISDSRRKLADLSRRIDAEEEAKNNIAANLRIKVSPTLLDMLEQIEEKIVSLTNDRKALEATMVRERGAQPSSAFLARIRETRAALDDPDLAVRRDARTMVRDSLQEIVTEMLCHTDGSVVVTIAHGLAAFRVNDAGQIDWQYDASGDQQAIRALTTEAYEDNASTVETVLTRAKR